MTTQPEAKESLRKWLQDANLSSQAIDSLILHGYNAIGLFMVCNEKDIEEIAIDYNIPRVDKLKLKLAIKRYKNNNEQKSIHENDHKTVSLAHSYIKEETTPLIKTEHANDIETNIMQQKIECGNNYANQSQYINEKIDNDDSMKTEINDADGYAQVRVLKTKPTKRKRKYDNNFDSKNDDNNNHETKRRKIDNNMSNTSINTNKNPAKPDMSLIKIPSTPSHLKFNHLEVEELKMCRDLYKKILEANLFQVEHMAARANVTKDLFVSWVTGIGKSPTIINDFNQSSNNSLPELDPSAHLSMNCIRLLLIEIRKQLETISSDDTNAYDVDTMTKVKNLLLEFQIASGLYAQKINEFKILTHNRLVEGCSKQGNVLEMYCVVGTDRNNEEKCDWVKVTVCNFDQQASRVLVRKSNDKSMAYAVVDSTILRLSQYDTDMHVISTPIDNSQSNEINDTGNTNLIGKSNKKIENVSVFARTALKYIKRKRKYIDPVLIVNKMEKVMAKKHGIKPNLLPVPQKILNQFKSKKQGKYIIMKK